MKTICEFLLFFFPRTIHSHTLIPLCSRLVMRGMNLIRVPFMKDDIGSRSHISVKMRGFGFGR